MSFASWKERKFIAQALRGVYRAETPEAGMAARVVEACQHLCSAGTHK